MLSILELPSDILSQVFVKLDGCSLLQCRQVCHVFADTISEDGTLQYYIALYTSGLVDDPSSLASIPTIERRQRLQKLLDARSAWADSGPASVIELPHSGPTRTLYWEYSSGLLATLPTVRSFRHTDLLSPTPAPSTEVDIPLDGIDTGTFFTEHRIDRYQDLLIVGVLKTNSFMNEDAALYIFSLSTGKPHPDAAKPFIELEEYGGNFACPHFEIYGDLILSSENIDGTCWGSAPIVYNWKTGEVVTHIENGPDLGLTFLGSDHLIGCACNHADSTIELPIYSLKTSKCVLTLQLPQMVDDALSDLESDPLLDHRRISLPPPSQRQKPFYTSPHGTIISLIIRHKQTWGFACVFPQSDILQLVKTHELNSNGEVPVLEWGSWPQSLFTFPYGVASSCYGSRLAIATLKANTIQVFDFHPRWFARAMTTVQYDEIFKEPFKTVLPPQPSQEMSLPMTPDYGSIILDEGGLIMVS
ncbi:hypothetical protein BDN72DRAFT_848494, partial [Pluteus cervinus]